MALSLVTSTSLALRPDSQHALAHRPEITPATRESETAQYKNVLAVAVSQEQRLSRNGAVRRGAGYDMTDPFMVATSEMDFNNGKPSKPLEFAKLEVPGLPCQVVGDTTVVAAFLRVVKDKDKPKKPQVQECLMRFPDGQEKSVPRNRLLPLPTRPPRQCDWAMAIDLKGERERYNGFRCICGLAVPQEPPAFWVMFELSAGGNGSMAPLVELLPLTNLVALPSMPYGGPETEWEARLRALPDIGKLQDDPGQTREPVLALKDEEEDDGEEDLTDEEGEALEVGDVVMVKPDNTLGILKKLDEKLAQVHFLPRSTSDSATQLETYDKLILIKSSLEEAEQMAVCTVCQKAKPEAELLICENFCKSCAGTIHLKCLDPPLQKVPEGDWFCPFCVKEQRRATKAKAAPKVKAKAQGKAKAKAKPKVKASAKASIAKRKA